MPAARQADAHVLRNSFTCARRGETRTQKCRSVGATRTPVVIATGVLAVVVTCGLWWSYFRHARQALSDALAARTGSARSCLARDVFSVLHFAMLCGVIAIAAATEAALAHPEEVLAADLRAALGVGTMLFVCGTAAAMWRAAGRPLPWRWAAAPLVAIVVFAMNTVPWVALTLVFAMLVAICAVEHVVVPPVESPTREPHVET
jgi:low temperature requirement protein LtrA